MKKLPFAFIILVIIGIVSWFVFLLTRVNLQLLNPKGIIASYQSMIIAGSMGLMLLIAVPIIISFFIITWKYRQGNSKAKHAPDWGGDKKIIIASWTFFGSLLIFFMSVIWITSHKLDPYVPIASDQKPKVIQVVALDWKWLFIYPEEGIATVNFLEIPINTPINFKLTADAPMNSFWIPSLGGQIYAMSTMQTQINLMGEKIGDYPGGAAEINGKGFSGMRFITRVSSGSDFSKWVDRVKLSENYLDQRKYDLLFKPSENNSVVFYSGVDPNLYNNILMKDMMPTKQPNKLYMEEMNQ